MTLEQVRSKTERIREFSALPFLLVAAVSLLGAIYRPAPQIVTGGAINPGDVAWMLTATGLVLLMTPGLSFFYGGMVGLQERRLDDAAELCRAGADQPRLGRRRIQPGLRRQHRRLSSEIR